MKPRSVAGLFHAARVGGTVLGALALAERRMARASKQRWRHTPRARRVRHGFV